MTNETNDWTNRYTTLLKYTDELSKYHLLENKRKRQKQIERQWTPEKRARQSAIINDSKPWLRSTGPKTALGKAASAQNNYKHGLRSACFREILGLMKMQRAYLRRVRGETADKTRELHRQRAYNKDMEKHGKDVATINLKAKQMKQALAEAGVKVDMREIKRAIKEITGHDEAAFITAPETPLSDEQDKALDELTARRAGGEPLYRILGKREFWGLEFNVTPDTLDPRPDTEVLIEAALKWVKATSQINAKAHPSEIQPYPSEIQLHPSESWDLPPSKGQDPKPSLGCGNSEGVIASEGRQVKNTSVIVSEAKQSSGVHPTTCHHAPQSQATTCHPEPVEGSHQCASAKNPSITGAITPSAQDDNNGRLRILDLGTGTGCIPIALLCELPNATAMAVDVSPAAVAVARQNADNHQMGGRLNIIEGDWFAGLNGESFDLILSNPPYIPESDIADLDVEVKNHDPKLALSGGESGLDAYRKIIFGLKNHLNQGGKAFLEIGIGQLESLAGLVEESGLCLCDSHRDLSGIPRVVEICSGDK